jgi:hypothetical protein
LVSKPLPLAVSRMKRSTDGVGKNGQHNHMKIRLMCSQRIQEKNILPSA